METPALWLAFACLVPLMIYTGWHDVRYLIIPNWVVVATLGIYVVFGFWGLPIETFLWGLAGGVIALFIGFGLYLILGSIGIAGIGAGDLKLIAALVPFMWSRDALEIVVIFGVVIWVFLVGFIIAWRRYRRSSRYAALGQDEKSTMKVASPFGVSLALTIVIYMGRQVLETL
ncbi:MAG: prepilin peptidase [Pseudomonadota bacterium]